MVINSLINVIEFEYQNEFKQRTVAFHNIYIMWKATKVRTGEHLGHRQEHDERKTDEVLPWQLGLWLEEYRCREMRERIGRENFGGAMMVILQLKEITSKGWWDYYYYGFGYQVENWLILILTKDNSFN